MNNYENKKMITPGDSRLNYMGRIDFSTEKVATFIYPYSMVKFTIKGTSLKVILKNYHSFWNNYLGVIIDGVQHKMLLSNEGETEYLSIGEDLENKEHDIILFKRQDACCYFDFYGLILSENTVLLDKGKQSLTRKIEFYGDSVTAGEVSEALDYVGKSDPEHEGEYSNSWYSYASITARKLNAEVNLVAQGGVALLDGTGYFVPPTYIGMENVYDKLRYNPQLGQVKKWDFNQFTPHVVVVAIGQNDNHPEDYMKEDYFGKKAVNWRNHYKYLIKRIRANYPDALIILSTTILMHHENWDQAIDEVCKELADKKVVHFMYSLNGKGTPGHIRIPEAEQMAEELTQFIESYGEEIWN